MVKVRRKEVLIGQPLLSWLAAAVKKPAKCMIFIVMVPEPEMLLKKILKKKPRRRRQKQKILQL